MGERDGARKYLYWAERRVHSIANGNGPPIGARRLDAFGRQPIPRQSQLGLETAQAGAEFRPRRMDRNGLALTIEMALGDEAVSDLTRRAPIRYAHGRGTIVLSEFAHEPDDPAMGLAFTEVVAGDGTRTAVCLFGSIAEYADVITDVAPQVRGWSAASTRVISEFVKSRCTRGDVCWGGPSTLAAEVLRVATRQGEERGIDDAQLRPWRRGFTYGHVREVGEWFAEIYLDVWTADVPTSRERDGGLWAFDRVLVGVPLWIRTPSLRALTLYDEIPAEELDLDIGRYD